MGCHLLLVTRALRAAQAEAHGGDVQALPPWCRHRERQKQERHDAHPHHSCEKSVQLAVVTHRPAMMDFAPRIDGGRATVSRRSASTATTAAVRAPAGYRRVSPRASAGLREPGAREALLGRGGAAAMGVAASPRRATHTPARARRLPVRSFFERFDANAVKVVKEGMDEAKRLGCDKVRAR